jgi:hypothetical protein
MELGDIKPMHIALGVIVHHYIRLTLKSAREPFVDRDNMITPEEKWGLEACRKYAPEHYKS